MRQRMVLSIAVLVVLLGVGCSKKPDDAALVTNIKSQMFSDAQLKDANLQVTSSDGQVTLRGTVPSDAARYEAYKLATQTPGVTKVNDQMTVQTAEAPSAVPPTPEAPAKPAARTRSHRARVKKPARTPPAVQTGEDAPPPAPVPVPAPAPAPAPVAQEAPPPLPPPPPQPKEVEVPAGATVTIRMIDGVDSSVNHAGEIFHASLEAPLVVGDQVVVSKGADVYVRLVSASSAGHMTGRSELHMELVKLEYQGRSYPLVSSTYTLSGSSRGKNTAAKVGGGAAIGALIGAIAGGGRGAAIGAGVGAGSGAVWNGVTRGKQVKIPSETKLDFQLEQPVTVTVMPRASLSSN